MKFLLRSVPVFIIFNYFNTSQGQSLQLHYDLRHIIDPASSAKNYPTVYFEYYKMIDTGKAFVKPAGFFLKIQADMNGLQNNISNSYLQASQEFKFSFSKILLALQYGGGLGVTEPKQYSYYITNTYSTGLSYHYNVGGFVLSSILFYRYAVYQMRSHDLGYTGYLYRGLFNYKVEIASDFTMWTENINHGDDATIGLTGKRIFGYGEIQGFYNLNRLLSVGCKTNFYYHVNTVANVVNAYPAIAIRFKL